VLVPCDAIEACKATIEAARINGPVYLRFGRAKTAVFTDEQTPFSIGKAQLFWHPPAGGEQPQAAIIACGSLVYNALLAAKELESDGLQVLVINNHTIKPLDQETILNAAKQTRAVVTVEEHQVQGGMGSAVAECLAKNFPVPMEFIGVQNQFGQSGKPEELVEHYGMGVKAIKEAVRKVISRKLT